MSAFNRFVWTPFVGALLMATCLAVSGCGGGGGGGAGGAGPVSGRVINLGKVPVPGATIAINGTSVTTDQNGAFHFDNISRPYTIALHHTGIRTIYDTILYVGLTRSDPTLTIDSIGRGTDSILNVSGVVTGGEPFPIPPNHTTHVGVTAANHIRSSTNTTGAGQYDRSFIWRGAATYDATMYVLQYEYDANSNPIAYKGFARRDVTFDDGVPSTQDFVLSPVQVSSISGEMTVPPNASLNIRLRLPPKFETPIHSQTGLATGPFSVSVPAIAGATYDIQLRHSVPGFATGISTVHDVTAGTSGLSISNPGTVAALISPPDVSSNVTQDTVFSGNAIAKRVYRFEFEFDGTGSSENIEVFSNTPRITLAPIAWVGTQLVPDDDYKWALESFGPFDSLDEFVGPNGIRAVPTLYETRPGGWEFRTAP